MMSPTPVGEVSWVLAFLAGVVSFLSPCVLPLIPGYISMVSKLSLEELRDNNPSGKIKKIVLPTILFVLGFSVVFVMLGASASLLGSFLQKYKTVLLKLSGAVVVLFGLFVMEIIRIPWLYREKRLHIRGYSLGTVGTFFLGVAFGFGWTPCVGPILGSILLYASTTEGVAKGALLLFTYSAGLGIPFLITGLALSRTLLAFNWIKRHYGVYKFVVGGALVVVGVLMFTNNLYYLNVYGQKILDLVGVDFWKTF
jgi:cytochrome c-type biogenesis protein